MSEEVRRRAADELALSRAWNAQWLRPGAALRTTDGRSITVVHRGRWTFGFGPDFRGALIAFGSELREGDVEVHLRASGWRAHGHHLDAAYDNVILHVVLDGEPGAICRRRDGALVRLFREFRAIRRPYPYACRSNRAGGGGRR